MHRSGGDGPVYQYEWTVAVTGLAGGHLQALSAGHAGRGLPLGGMSKTRAMCGVDVHGKRVSVSATKRAA